MQKLKEILIETKSSIWKNRCTIHIILNGLFMDNKVLYIKSIRDENIEVVVIHSHTTDNYKDCKTLPKEQK